MPQRLGIFLNASPQFAALSQQMRQLAALEQLYQQVAPPPLRAVSHVMLLHGRTLIIAADNGAIAAKLRQLSADLISSLRTRGCEVTGIQIKVQVRAQTAVPRPPQRKLGKAARHSLEDLAARLPEGPLRTSLHRLLKRSA